MGDPKDVGGRLAVGQEPGGTIGLGKRDAYKVRGAATRPTQRQIRPCSDVSWQRGTHQKFLIWRAY
jgi:hypothetical protein